MSFSERLDKMDPNKAKMALTEFIKDYMTPAYGSLTKRDIDIMLFIKLQDLGILSKNPDIYELVSTLRVTRSKARNLLYESKLRQTTADGFDDELKLLLVNPLFLKDNDKMGIEIDNPYLIDHLRSKLKALNYITDGSFSPELVRLSTDAFVALYEYYLPEASKSKVKKALIDSGVVADDSLHGLIKEALKVVGKKVANEAGAQLVDSIDDYLEPLLKGSATVIKNKFSKMMKNSK